MNLTWNRKAGGGFTRNELLVALGIGAVLAVLGGVSAGQLKLRAKRLACVANLQRVSTATALYAQHNGDRLPYAGLRANTGVHWSWDDLISSEMSESWTAKELQSSNPEKPRPYLLCPSDTAMNDNSSPKTKGIRRTYAMPQHNMLEENWPPGANNATGVGITWVLGKDSSFPESVDRWQLPEKGTPKALVPAQPAFRRAAIPAPAKTIFLTERSYTKNLVGSVTGSFIQNPGQHLESAAGLKLADYHQGKFNYLCIDGHVEALKPHETLGSSGEGFSVASGMWTVKPND